MNKILRLLPVFLALTLLPPAALAQYEDELLSERADRLVAFLDGLDVTDYWRATYDNVDWKTGFPTDNDSNLQQVRGHSAAFVAAACDRLGVYIPRPPEHSQGMLADAQYDWLLSQGASRGWKQLPNMRAAQRAARDGLLVVAVCKNPDPDKDGHAAIVRPSTKTAKLVGEEGPDVVSAGLKNYNSVSLKTAFELQRGAFANRQILFFAHEINWDKARE